MKIIEPINALGEFWLPDTPEIKITGTLTIKEDGSITIIAMHKLSRKFKQHFEIVLGIMENGQNITVIDAISHTTPLASKCSLSVRSVILGMHIVDEDFELTNLSFSMEGLRLLQKNTGLESTELENGHSFSYKSQEKSVIELDNNIKISLHSFANCSIKKDNISINTSISENYNITLNSEKPMSSFLFFEIMKKFSNFMNAIGNIRTHVFNIKSTYKDVDIRFYIKPKNAPYFNTNIYEIADPLRTYIVENLSTLLLNWYNFNKIRENEITCFLTAKREIHRANNVYTFLDLSKSIESFYEEIDSEQISSSEVKKKSKLIYNAIKEADTEGIVNDIELFTKRYIKFQSRNNFNDKLTTLLSHFFYDIFNIDKLPESACDFIKKIVKSRNTYTHLTKLKKEEIESLYFEQELFQISNFLIILTTYHILVSLEVKKNCIKDYILKIFSNDYMPELISKALYEHEVQLQKTREEHSRT